MKLNDEANLKCTFWVDKEVTIIYNFNDGIASIDKERGIPSNFCKKWEVSYICFNKNQKRWQIIIHKMGGKREMDILSTY